MYPQCWGDRTGWGALASQPASSTGERRASVRDPVSKERVGAARQTRRIAPKGDTYLAAICVCARAHRHIYIYMHACTHTERNVVRVNGNQKFPYQ